MARVSTTSKTTLAYAVETVYGQAPTVVGKKLRIRSESLGQEIEKIVSEEIEASRQTRSMILTNVDVSGNIEAELSAQEFDDLFSAALMGNWTTYGTNGASPAAELSINNATKTITFATAPTTTSALTNLKPGQYVSLAGASLNPKNVQPVKVVSVTATEITYTGANLVDQANVQASLRTGYLTHDNVEKSFTLEKFFAEKGLYYIYTGMRLNQFTLSVSAREVVTLSFEFIGQGSEQKSVATFTTPYTESFDHPVIDATLGASNLLFDGAPITELGSAGVRSFELTFSNNMEGQEAVAVLGNVDVMTGDITCTISAEIYADDGNFYNDALAQTRRNVSFALFDRNGRGYAVTLPSVEFSASQPQAGGKNQALAFTIEGTALMDPTTRKTVAMSRF